VTKRGRVMTVPSKKKRTIQKKGVGGDCQYTKKEEKANGMQNLRLRRKKRMGSVNESKGVTAGSGDLSILSSYDI